VLALRTLCGCREGAWLRDVKRLDLAHVVISDRIRTWTRPVHARGLRAHPAAFGGCVLLHAQDVLFVLERRVCRSELLNGLQYAQRLEAGVLFVLGTGHAGAMAESNNLSPMCGMLFAAP